MQCASARRVGPPSPCRSFRFELPRRGQRGGKPDLQNLLNFIRQRCRTIESTRETRGRGEVHLTNAGRAYRFTEIETPVRLLRAAISIDSLQVSAVTIITVQAPLSPVGDLSMDINEN